MRVLDLFAGIGGFSLGLERAGFETVAFCEIDPYAQQVLAKHWPGVPIYDDVRTITAERLAGDGVGVDIITGGFPCQDISTAGNQAGIQDGTRSGLWSECARLLGEIRPRYAIFENVTNLLNGERGAWFKRVLWDISKVGYDAEWHCIPASELGAHHHRDRIWIVAYPNGNSQSGRTLDAGKVRSSSLFPHPGHKGVQQRGECAGDCKKSKDSERVQRDDAPRRQKKERGFLADTDGAQRQRGCLSIGIRAQYANIVGASGWGVEPDVDRVADGIPARSHRLKCLGNAVVPQIPELIGSAIMGELSHE